MTKRTKSIVSSLIVSALAGSSLWAQTPEGCWKEGANIVNEARQPARGSAARAKKTDVRVQVSKSKASPTAADKVAGALAIQAKQARAKKLISKLRELEVNRDDTRRAKDENYRLAQKTGKTYHEMLSWGLAGSALSAGLLAGVVPNPYIQAAKAVASLAVACVSLPAVAIAIFSVEPELDSYLKRAARYSIEERKLNEQIIAKAEELRRLQIEISTAK